MLQLSIIFYRWDIISITILNKNQSIGEIYEYEGC